MMSTRATLRTQRQTFTQVSATRSNDSKAGSRVLACSPAQRRVGFKSGRQAAQVQQLSSRACQLSAPRARRNFIVVRAAAADEALDNSDKTVVVFGCTGYIGKAVTKELLQRGYQVVAFTREKSGIGGKSSLEAVQEDFPGATIVGGDVMSKESIGKAFTGKVEAVVSCLASRTGGIQDSWDIDYQATLNTLDVARENGAEKYVLLSAICVQKPDLTFQKAKLKFEAALMGAGDIKYSIVRPTAFFKSLAGQIKSCQGGGPYVMFGDGQLASCKPISEEELSEYMVNCIEQEELQNKVLPIGGPGKALTPLEQGTMLFKLLGKEPKFIKVPIQVMDVVISFFDFLVKYFPSLADPAEFGKIGRYYAAESMLVLDENGKYQPDLTPSYGETDLETFFKRCIDEGMEGQELGDAAIFSE